MPTITKKINTRLNKGKQLISLINELAKEGAVEFEKSTTYRDVQKGIRDMKSGKVKPINDQMNISISFTHHFETQYKWYKKKFKSLESDIDDFTKNLNQFRSDDPGNGFHKYRLTVKSTLKESV